MIPVTTFERVLTAVLLVCASALALAQARYENPAGRFHVPVPTGWTDESPNDYALFVRTEPDGRAYVLAAPGEQDKVLTSALQVLVDSGLDPEFAAAPLQSAPVQLPSGTWTQRIYAYGDELLAAIALEEDGLTYVVLARGTQEAFMQAINAAANQLLLGFEKGPLALTEEEDPGYVVEEVSFASGDITLAGTLTLPTVDGPHPAIILISGSGAQDRDGANPALPGYRPMRWLADHLTREGVAVLRFDERGVAESGGDHLTATSLDFADDNEAALRFLQERADIDPKQVGFLGHSEGSMIAAMVAARNPDEVAFVISMAGAFVPGVELLLVQLERIVRATGATEDEVAQAKEQQRQILDLALAQDWEGLEDFVHTVLLEQLEELPEEQRAPLGDLETVARQRTAAQLEGLRSPWFELFLSYDPRDDWRQITVPVLAVFGELDTQVDVAQNKVEFEAAMEDAGNEDATAIVFDTANHLFQEAVTGGPDEYLTLDMEFLPSFLQALSDWLLERVEVSRP